MENEPDKNLYGDWQALTGVLAGEAMPEDIIAATKLTIRESEYVVDLAGNIDRGLCKIQPDANPVRMQIDGKHGPNAGKTFLAILEYLSPNQIRIAYDLSGTNYPQSFEPTPTSSNYVATFEKYS